MVTDSPPSPSVRMAATAVAPSPSATSQATKTQSRPASAKAALRMAGDSEWRMGWPITAASRVAPPITRRRRPGGSPAPEALGRALLLQVLELAVAVGEGEVALGVDQHVVDPVARCRVEGGLQAGLARRGDRRRRQALVQPGVVRRGPVEVGLLELAGELALL